MVTNEGVIVGAINIDNKKFISNILNELSDIDKGIENIKSDLSNGFNDIVDNIKLEVIEGLDECIDNVVNIKSNLLDIGSELVECKNEILDNIAKGANDIKESIGEVLSDKKTEMVERVNNLGDDISAIKNGVVTKAELLLSAAITGFNQYTKSFSKFASLCNTSIVGLSNTVAKNIISFAKDMANSQAIGAVASLTTNVGVGSGVGSTVGNISPSQGASTYVDIKRIENLAGKYKRYAKALEDAYEANTNQLYSKMSDVC